MWTYSVTGLTLSHYDAKAHLVVARRIFDSITPGWQQIGAVWLPLPHLINALPVQVDLFYRSGGFAIAVSVLANGLACASIAAVIWRLTASRAGAALAATLYAVNPNVLYLQATPMTEPLLFGLVALAVWLLTDWVTASFEVSSRLVPPRSVGWTMVAACMTRYEAWPMTALAIAASAFAWWRRGAPLAGVVRAHARLALYPVVAVLAFLAFSRATVGEWFVSGGFFVPDETLRGQPEVVVAKILEGTERLAGLPLVRAAQVAVPLLVLRAIVRRDASALLVPLALFGALALPLLAYLAGHPFRIRYEIPLILAAATAVGLAVGLLRRLAAPVALVLLVLVLSRSGPFDPHAAILAEAQVDAANARGRQYVTGCLRNRYDGGTIMVSMGALGHYMHELSAAGFAIRDFLHEGNGPIWDSAFTRGPAPFVAWVLVEEVAEGGDAVIQRHRLLPRLLADFDRVCSGGNVTLYQRR